jgi:alkylation response protein AidB-like acyl-CoA dehydrogenase
MVEKIRRDVRITTIYEGTSEIMEMTISRDRWQAHLKTRGEHYRTEARRLESLHARDAQVGANIVALASYALAEVLERVRVARLTRHQHILFRLGELIAKVEAATRLAYRAAALRDGSLNPKAERRFRADEIAAVSRVFARETALQIAHDGARWVVGAGDAEVAAFETAIGLTALLRSQAGLLADMDIVADAVYRRSPSP